MMIKHCDGNGRMSKAVIAGDTIYFCGQTSRDGGDIKVQTEAVLKMIFLLHMVLISVILSWFRFI